MSSRIVGLIIVLGALLAVGVEIAPLVVLALLLLLGITAWKGLWHGKGDSQFWASLGGLLFGPCLVALFLRYCFAQLHFPALGRFALGWSGILLLAGGLVLVSLLSYAIVKKRLRILQADLPPSTNERQPVYAPRRREKAEK